MQNNLPTIVDTPETAVLEANRQIAVELVPMAVSLLRDMLEAEQTFQNGINVPKPRSAKTKSIDLVNIKTYGRYHLELVKLTLSAAGVGVRSSSSKDKDLGKMTADDIAKLLDNAKIVSHEPAKSLALED